LETGISSKQDAQEILENTEVFTEKEDTTLIDPPSNHAETQTKALVEKGEEKTLPTMDKPATDIVGKQPSTKIGKAIQFVTPLKFNRGSLSVEVVFIKDLISISVEEMPPS
jgi:hypothetical protein